MRIAHFERGDLDTSWHRACTRRCTVFVRPLHRGPAGRAAQDIAAGEVGAGHDGVGGKHHLEQQLGIFS